MASKSAPCHASKSRGVAIGDWRMVLKCADTFSKQTEAVQTAITLGATLREIEEYLDYLDMSKEVTDAE